MWWKMNNIRRGLYGILGPSQPCNDKVLNNIALQFIEKDKNVLFISLKSRAIDLHIIFKAMLDGTDSVKTRKKALEGKDIERDTAEIKGLNIWSTSSSACDVYKFFFGIEDSEVPDALFIDAGGMLRHYLDTQNVELGPKFHDVFETLSNLARDFDLPVFVGVEMEPLTSIPLINFQNFYKYPAAKKLERIFFVRPDIESNDIFFEDSGDSKETLILTKSRLKIESSGRLSGFPNHPPTKSRFK